MYLVVTVLKPGIRERQVNVDLKSVAQLLFHKTYGQFPACYSILHESYTNLWE